MAAKKPTYAEQVALFGAHLSRIEDKLDRVLAGALPASTSLAVETAVEARAADGAAVAVTIGADRQQPGGGAERERIAAGDSAVGDIVAARPAPSTPVIDQVTPDPYPTPGTVIDGVTYFQAYRRGRAGVLPPIARRPEELVADRLVLPFARAVVMGEVAPAAKPYVPGSYKGTGLVPYFGTTGERGEIGLITTAQADWLMGAAPDLMLAQAEAHGSVPVHGTINGRVIDVLKYPLATFDYRAVNRPWQRPYFDIRVRDGLNGEEAVTPEGAHYPSLCYVPFLATLDLYYLAEVQFAATFMICGGPPDGAQGRGLVMRHQQRYYAWALRALAEAYVATLEAERVYGSPLSPPLLPSSYWLQILNNNLDEAFARRLTRQDGTPFATPEMTALVGEMGFLGTNDLNIAPWQQDYITTVLGWMVWTGRIPQAKPLYDFNVRQAVKRATGDWRSQAIHYYIAPPAPSLPQTAGHTMGPTWIDTLISHGFAPTVDGNYRADSTKGYIPYLRASTAVAVLNGVPGATDAFAFADAQSKRVKFIPHRWAVAVQ